MKTPTSTKTPATKTVAADGDVTDDVVDTDVDGVDEYDDVDSDVADAADVAGDVDEKEAADEDDAGTTTKSSKKSTSRPSAKALTKTTGKARTANKVNGKAADAKTAPKSRTEKKGRPTPSRDGGEKRASVIARLRRFLLEVVDQLRRVIWPTRKQLITYGGVVLVFLVFMVALVFGLDLALGKAVFWVFG
ncbi:MAG: preprotein translocase subunit SecE [Sciscionella sp.]|nr:preprotein translocase subunit SecE [Sciscionella sp.]